MVLSSRLLTGCPALDQTGPGNSFAGLKKSATRGPVAAGRVASAALLDGTSGAGDDEVPQPAATATTSTIPSRSPTMPIRRT